MIKWTSIPNWSEKIVFEEFRLTTKGYWTSVANLISDDVCVCYQIKCWKVKIQLSAVQKRQDSTCNNGKFAQDIQLLKHSDHFAKVSEHVVDISRQLMNILKAKTFVEKGKFASCGKNWTNWKVTSFHYGFPPFFRIHRISTNWLFFFLFKSTIWRRKSQQSGEQNRL